MEEEISDFRIAMNKAWEGFYQQLPAIFMAIIVFLLGFITIRYISKIVARVISIRSRNQLVTDFLVNIVSFILNVFLIVICLSILGWGNITNKILAGAGITTFIIGFALKDIGENFLAGILMAFRRPFRIGDLIEVDKVKGKVTRMTLRETRVKTLDGRDVYVPNGLILKTPLQNYTIDNLLRAEFIIGISYDNNLTEAINLIKRVLESFERIKTSPPAQVIIDEFCSTRINIRILFWFETDDVRAPGVLLRSDVMLKVFNELKSNGYNIPSDIVDVRMQQLKES